MGGADGLVTGHTPATSSNKRISVLAFLHHTFVVCDIFGSEKIIRPAWVLGSAALLLAVSSVEKPRQFTLFICFFSLRVADCVKVLVRPRTRRRFFSPRAAAHGKSCVRKSCEVPSCDIFSPAKNPPSCLGVMVCSSKLPSLYTQISKILRPACLVVKFCVTYRRPPQRIFL